MQIIGYQMPGKRAKYYKMLESAEYMNKGGFFRDLAWNSAYENSYL